MLLTLIATSLAGTPADDLAELLAGGAYTRGVVCSPAGVVYDTVRMGVQVLEAAGQVWDPEAMEHLKAWLAPDSERGLDRAGTLAGAGAEGEGAPQHITIAFAGTAEDFDALAQALLEDELRHTDQGYVTQDGVPVVLVDGALRIHRGTDAMSTFPVELLADFGGQTGCVLAADTAVLPGGAPEGLQAFSVFAPLDSEELFLARLEGLDLPDGVETLASSPSQFRGSSTLPPDFVVLIAADGIQAMRIALDLGQDGDLEFADVLEGLSDRARIPPGLTLAVYGQKKARRIVAVVPVTNAKGKPIKARKLMVLMADALALGDSSWEQQGDDGYRIVRADGTESWIRISNGQIVVGELPEAVAEAHAGVGVAWGSAEAAALSASWPVVVVPGQLPQISMAVPVALGVRFQAGIVELGLDSLEGKDNDFLVGMFVGLAVPNFVEMRWRARRAELTVGLSAVVTAQIGYHAVHETYIAVPMAPRSVEALTIDKATWVEDPAWQALGYGPSEPIRASYAVELTDDGFVAHGWMDADGDGVPAHMIVTGTPDGPSPPELLTPESVY